MKPYSSRSYAYLLIAALVLSLIPVWAAKSEQDKTTSHTQSEKKTDAKAKKEPLDGSWTGTYSREGQTNNLSMNLTQEGGAVKGTLTAGEGTFTVEKGAYDAQTKKVTFEIQVGGDARYQVTGTLESDALRGQWKGAGEEGTFQVTRVKQ